MAIDFEEMNGGRTLEVQVTGLLAKKDYQHLLPRVYALIKQHGKIRVFLDMTGFQGWSPEALWEDLSFDVKKFLDIERIAVIGERKWQEGISLLCRPMKSARIRCFDPSQSDIAHRWTDDV